MRTIESEIRAVVTVDPSREFQTMDGYGFTLTGASARVLHEMGAAERAAILEELFGRGATGIGIGVLRLSIGASDLSDAPFTCDDVPEGEVDPSLARFSIDREREHLLPILKEILAVEPSIRIIAAPWTAPPWMKTFRNFFGGNLESERYGVYAQYFVKYIRQMQDEGIVVDAVSPQNEPLNAFNVPSMIMRAEEQADFVKNHLGPALRSAGLATRIMIYDHNCDHPEYPISILDDPEAREFVEGSAFHLYAGSVDALSAVHDAHPDKGIFFTEQWTGARAAFDADLGWHVRNVIIGASRNRARSVLEWNLATDPSFGPHTEGGCTECRGALTVGASIERNVSYYVVGHASKFVSPGSIRIQSDEVGPLHDVAFRTPGGNVVLIAENEGPAIAFTIRVRDSGQVRSALASLPAKSVATYVW